MQDDTNIFYAINLENSVEFGLQFLIQAKSKVEVSRQISTNPKWMRKKQTVERKHTKEPLAGQFSILSQYSVGQAYLTEDQKQQRERMLEARLSNGSTVLTKKEVERPSSPATSAASTLKDGKTLHPLKSIKNTDKTRLKRQSAFDNNSVDSSNLNSKPVSGQFSSGQITGQLQVQLNSSFRGTNNSSPSDGSNIIDCGETDTLIPVARENSLGGMKSALETISSLKSNKSSKNKKNKEKKPTVDCACQTDFPWTEEDEKRERRRRKRERAEMRKQMYMLKKEVTPDNGSRILQKSSSNATLMNSQHEVNLRDNEGGYHHEGNSFVHEQGFIQGNYGGENTNYTENNNYNPQNIQTAHARVDSYENGDQQNLLNDSSECEMRKLLMENSNQQNSGSRDLNNYVHEDKNMDLEEVERRKRQLQKLKKATKQALQTAAKGGIVVNRESSSSRSKSQSRSRSRSKSKVRSSLSLAKDGHF